MVDLAVAAILSRAGMEEQFEMGRRGTPPAAPDAQSAQVQPRARFLRVASLVTRRSTEETWPRSRSRTSAC